MTLCQMQSLDPKECIDEGARNAVMEPPRMRIVKIVARVKKGTVHTSGVYKIIGSFIHMNGPTGSNTDKQNFYDEMNKFIW